MSGLRIARLCLVLSMALFAGAVLLAKLAPGSWQAAWLIGLAAVAGLVFSATSCIALQLLAALRGKARQHG